jgi:hypothetical protein
MGTTEVIETFHYITLYVWKTMAWSTVTLLATTAFPEICTYSFASEIIYG